MKKNELTKVVLAALVLASSSVLAASDYPAADFQPKVLYSDESAQSAPDAAPAAAAPAAVVEEADSNYPAASYQPKVLFKDAEYKHSAAAPSAGSSATSSSSATAASAELEVIQTEKAASTDFSYIGLIALAFVGFFLYSKKSGEKSASSTAVDYSVAEGATGVEKYLEKMGANKTGVAKYLEKQTANPSTGVAKYMAKQIVKDREAAAARATGVEKYLRDKG